jgi:hypothetical protein
MLDVACWPFASFRVRATMSRFQIKADVKRRAGQRAQSRMTQRGHARGAETMSGNSDHYICAGARQFHAPWCA